MWRLWTFSDFCSRHIVGVAGDDIMFHILVLTRCVLFGSPIYRNNLKIYTLWNNFHFNNTHRNLWNGIICTGKYIWVQCSAQKVQWKVHINCKLSEVIYITHEFPTYKSPVNTVIYFSKIVSHFLYLESPRRVNSRFYYGCPSQILHILESEADCHSAKLITWIPDTLICQHHDAMGRLIPFNKLT